ncbi:MAG: hypothetical protein JWM37_556 [Candidatus Saccharibacteria bacterium]|nr:hypothetical protein [Candidatus Saccharibacteria bacterium]
MEQKDQNASDSLENKDSLENPDSSAPAGGAAPEGSGNLEGMTPEEKAAASPVKKQSALKKFVHKFNIYLLLFGLLLAVAVVIAVVLAINAKKAENEVTIGSQTLTAEALKQLSNSDVSVGDAKQLLTVQSNAIFTGKLLVRQDLEVAGNLTVGGTINISGLKVTGAGTFDTLQANKLTLTGDMTLQGQLSVQKSLIVNGSGTFSGPVTAPSINTSSLLLNGDFATTKHITVGGTAPSKGDGNALGSGGTSSVSGSDTAGSVTVNIGTGAAAGCFINITFAQKFATTPKVLVTPVGQAAGGIDYYVTRTANGFSICTSTGAPASSSFGFDYFVVG